MFKDKIRYLVDHGHPIKIKSFKSYDDGDEVITSYDYHKFIQILRDKSIQLHEKKLWNWLVEKIILILKSHLKLTNLA